MTKTHPLIGVLLLLFIPAFTWGQANDIVDQKTELEQLEHDVSTSQQRLDSLQNKQRAIQQQIGNQDQRMSSDRKVIGRLSNQLSALKRAIGATDSALAARQLLLDHRTRRHLGNLREFYIAARRSAHVISDRPNGELDLNRKIILLSALTGFESAGVQAARQLLDVSEEELSDLSGQQSKVRGLKKNKETNYALTKAKKQSGEKEYDRLRRKSRTEADRMMMLRQAAEEMSAIISRLEALRNEGTPGRRAANDDAVFAGLKGTLRTPLRGKIVDSYGKHTDPVTKLKSFSPGITIQGRANATVNLVASGTVAYAGELRGYGNFVIINHEGQYYTTYAELGEISVGKDQYLTSGTRIGTAGRDGKIRFELRKGRDPLDPVKWIRIESF